MSHLKTTAALIGAVLLLAVGLVASGAPQPNRLETPPAATASRAGWEYKVLPRAEIVKLSPTHRGEEYILPEDVLDDFNAGLDVLGEQGWELVAVEPHHREGYVSWPAMYMFRRGK